MTGNRRKDHLDRAIRAKRESKYLDFKREFDPSSKREWVEIIKDLVAMANSGGGVLVIGVENGGASSGAPIEPTLELDPATIADKVHRYTGKHFSGFSVSRVARPDGDAAVIEVEASPRILVFVKPGTYTDPNDGGGQQRAFSAGTVYVRHGAKSEHADSDDIESFIEGRIEQIREAWLGNIQKVVRTSDAGFGTYSVVSYDQAGSLSKIRVTDDPDAPVFGRIDPDDSHPYRQKELVERVNDLLPDSQSINRHDIHCVKRVREINEDTNPQFVHTMKYGSPQYSEQFAEWLASQDQAFFDECRRLYRERNKP